MPRVEVSYPRIDTARSIVRTERDILECEIKAFEAFCDRLDRLDSTVSASPAIEGGVVATSPMQGLDPEAVRTAYRDTVLAVEHYDREYGEPLLEHVESEFGPDVRAVFAAAAPIPSVQRDAVAGAVEEAVDRRRRVRGALVRELDSLTSVADRLGDVERRFHALTGDAARHPGGHRAELEALAETCEAIAVERQSTIHERPTPRLSGIGQRSLVAYLYGANDHRFPALVEVANVAARIARILDGSIP